MRTVGEILKKARQEKRITIEEAEKVLRIRKKFLEALESNNWNDLPSLPYIKGFLNNYSSYLGLIPQEILAIFRREFQEKEDTRLLPENKSKEVSETKIRITPTFITIGIITAAVTLFFSYLFFQYRAYTNPPDLIINTPEEGQVVRTQTIDIKGKTDPDATLSVNEEQIALDKDGIFSTTLKLSPGINTVTFESVNKHNKKRVVNRTVSYEETTQ